MPEQVNFATKPALAGDLITRAIDAGVPANWVAGDEVYGADGKLRRVLEARGVGYVRAVARDHQVVTTTRTRTGRGSTMRVEVDKLRVDKLAAGLPKRAWQQISAGAGSKGQRFYDWAWVAITPQPTKTQPIDTSPGYWWLLIRRNNTTGELAFYRCYSPAPVPLSRLVRAAGRRWRIEESFQSSKNLAGLDHHQVRRWNSWHRWTLLAMLAHALLTVLAVTERDRTPATTTGPEAGIIDLTCNEIHRLLNHLRPPAHDIEHRLAWSRWRRRHQHRARTCHYARRGHTPPP